MISRPFSPLKAFENASEHAAKKAIKEQKRGKLAMVTLTYRWELTFSWECSSVQTYPSENYLFRFLGGREMCLKWHQATCFESALEESPSLYRLLPSVFQEDLIQKSFTSQELWSQCAHAINPKQITVIPRGDINAVKLSFSPIEYPNIVSHVFLQIIFPDARLSSQCIGLMMNTSVNLQFLLAHKPPCLIVAFPAAELTINSLGEMTNTRFFSPDAQTTIPTEATIAAAFRAEHGLVMRAITAYAVDRRTPCAFLLDVAEK